MSIKLPESHTLRQLIGAAGGMAVAGLVYVAFQGLSTVQLNQAMLVDLNPTMSENAGELVVNDKNIDPDTLKRLQSRAQQVAKQQEAAREEEPVVATEPEAAPTELQQNVQDRLDARTVMLNQLTATTHNVPANTFVNDKDRVQLRAERMLALQQGQSVVAAQYQSQVPTQQAVAGDLAAARFVEEVHAGADPSVVQAMPAYVTPPPSKNLTNSGVGMNLVVVLALLLGVMVRYNQPIRNRLFSL